MSNSNLKNKLNIYDLSGVEELGDADCVAVNGGTTAPELVSTINQLITKIQGKNLNDFPFGY